MKNDKKKKSRFKEIEVNHDPSELEIENDMLIGYESIMFLGTSIFNDIPKFKDDLLGAYHLCMEHFLEKKDYEKVNQILNILNMMNDTKPFSIDKEIFDLIDHSYN